MSTTDKDIEYIEKFFNLELSEDELSVFEARLEKEPEFAQKLKNYRLSIDLVEKEYTSDTEKTREEKWRAIVKEEKDPKIIKLNWKWIVGLAASFLLLFFGWQYIENTKQLDLAALTQDSWDKKIGLDYRMMRTTNHDSLQIIILNAFDAYEDKEYGKAYSILEPFIPTTIYYEDALLIRALSQYRLGNVEQSLRTLDTLSSFPSGKKAKVALWYQGLIYLDLGEKKAAQEFLLLPKSKDQNIKLKE
ncbi:tetratricopeptide repeat protein [Aquimarina algiphila]|uniref:tetratricopeptide repeat protein n=1 Tax=Aquimarina algiphila TaxID=2047982 RepID=UPI002493281B|nr:tetratricopeptide repeat protein [Aquimarina algiphila]